MSLMPRKVKEQECESHVTECDGEGPCGPVSAHHSCTLAPDLKFTLSPMLPSSILQQLSDQTKSLHEKVENKGDLCSRDLRPLDKAVLCGDT